MKMSFGLGTANYHRIVEEKNFTPSLLAHHMSEKIKYVDTAPIYAQGQAESWIGKDPVFNSKFEIFTKVGIDYSLSTKIGFRLPKGKSLYVRLFPVKVKRINSRKTSASILRSRKRLMGIEPFGVLVHSYDGSDSAIKQLSELRRLREKSLVKKIGISIDEVLPAIPTGIDILEINSDFSAFHLLQHFHGILILNQIFQKKLSQIQLLKLIELNLDEIVLLTGSTRIERIVTFVNDWETKFNEITA
jgi:hypothetical protein